MFDFHAFIDQHSFVIVECKINSDDYEYTSVLLESGGFMSHICRCDARLTNVLPFVSFAGRSAAF